jgi:branched-chain amino acid transport system substrate-binding protein
LGLIADAIKRAGSEDPAKIRDALAATKGYPGITGSITYPGDSRVPQKTVTMIGVKDDHLTLGAEVTPNWLPAPQYRANGSGPADASGPADDSA